MCVQVGVGVETMNYDSEILGFNTQAAHGTQQLCTLLYPVTFSRRVKWLQILQADIGTSGDPPCSHNHVCSRHFLQQLIGTSTKNILAEMYDRSNAAIAESLNISQYRQFFVYVGFKSKCRNERCSVNMSAVIGAWEDQQVE